jgi:hypothetical protein
MEYSRFNQAEQMEINNLLEQKQVKTKTKSN